MPVPDYRSALFADVEAEADALIAEARLDEALDLVQGFRATVEDDARLTYEQGLVLRLQGDTEGAEALYIAALEADATLAFAWYDLGELHLMAGRTTEARAALEQASAMSEEHVNGWAAPFRLAELSGLEGDARAFDQHLKEALRRGFRFATVVTDPTWTGFLADESLGEVLRRLMVVYGEERTLEQWGG
jgi:tetratricopeptide (TPR) repeat protein